ncbi:MULTISPECIES: hypothetical protein [Xenorhabdus]|uniref:Uncharacterized protein n=1 Tax=Xenorhabdus thuongxuanensis TaxID=1873484 RepID=A0A1Q5TXV5_9GAMM|nr:hypothetical protein [Xenorhabdus thuongxuanensis]OKP05065.1 hypothetical protein Xentx_02556 [Xenorhabdus thuongxuanensis]
MAVKIEILITSESGELKHEVIASGPAGEYTHQEYQAAMRLSDVLGQHLTHGGHGLVIHQVPSRYNIH